MLLRRHHNALLAFAVLLLLGALFVALKLSRSSLSARPHDHFRRIRTVLQPTFSSPPVPQDNSAGSYFDYVLTPYDPVKPPDAGSLSSYELFKLLVVVSASHDPAYQQRLLALSAALRAGLGRNQVVWGLKFRSDGRFAWELYVYDYQGNEAAGPDGLPRIKVHPGKRLSSFRTAVASIFPAFGCDLRAAEDAAYFMYSLDLLPAELERGRLEALHLYTMDQGSRGVDHLCSAKGQPWQLENYYQFYRPGSSELLSRAQQSVHIAAGNSERALLYDVLRVSDSSKGGGAGQLLHSTSSACFANKQRADGVYYSRATLGGLRAFLLQFEWPTAVIELLEANEAKLDHMLYSIGWDVAATSEEASQAVWGTKSGFYGSF